MKGSAGVLRSGSKNPADFPHRYVYSPGFIIPEIHSRVDGERIRIVIPKAEVHSQATAVVKRRLWGSGVYGGESDPLAVCIHAGHINLSSPPSSDIEVTLQLLGPSSLPVHLDPANSAESSWNTTEDHLSHRCGISCQEDASVLSGVGLHSNNPFLDASEVQHFRNLHLPPSLRGRLALPLGDHHLPMKGYQELKKFPTPKPCSFPHPLPGPAEAAGLPGRNSEPLGQASSTFGVPSVIGALLATMKGDAFSSSSSSSRGRGGRGSGFNPSSYHQNQGGAGYPSSRGSWSRQMIFPSAYRNGMRSRCLVEINSSRSWGIIVASVLHLDSHVAEVEREPLLASEFTPSSASLSLEEVNRISLTRRSTIPEIPNNPSAKALAGIMDFWLAPGFKISGGSGASVLKYTPACLHPRAPHPWSTDKMGCEGASRRIVGGDGILHLWDAGNGSAFRIKGCPPQNNNKGSSSPQNISVSVLKVPRSSKTSPLEHAFSIPDSECIVVAEGLKGTVVAGANMRVIVGGSWCIFPSHVAWTQGTFSSDFSSPGRNQAAKNRFNSYQAISTETGITMTTKWVPGREEPARKAPPPPPPLPATSRVSTPSVPTLTNIPVLPRSSSPDTSDTSVQVPSWLGTTASGSSPIPSISTASSSSTTGKGNSLRLRLDLNNNNHNPPSTASSGSKGGGNITKAGITKASNGGSLTKGLFIPLPTASSSSTIPKASGFIATPLSPLSLDGDVGEVGVVVRVTPVAPAAVTSSMAGAPSLLMGSAPEPKRLPLPAISGISIPTAPTHIPIPVPLQLVASLSKVTTGSPVKPMVATSAATPDVATPN